MNSQPDPGDIGRLRQSKDHGVSWGGKQSNDWLMSLLHIFPAVGWIGKRFFGVSLRRLHRHVLIARRRLDWFRQRLGSLASAVEVKSNHDFSSCLIEAKEGSYRYFEPHPLLSPLPFQYCGTGVRRPNFVNSASFSSNRQSGCSALGRSHALLRRSLKCSLAWK